MLNKEQEKNESICFICITYLYIIYKVVYDCINHMLKNKAEMFTAMTVLISATGPM